MALILAAENGQIEACVKLVELGAHPDSTDMVKNKKRCAFIAFLS